MNSSKQEQWRREGMAFCIRFLEEHDGDVEALKREIERRGAYGIPISVSRADEERFCEGVKHSCLDSVLVLTLVTLHDAFGFGRERLNRFKTLFNTKSECLAENYATWNDEIAILEQECGLKMNIRWFGGDPTAGVDPMDCTRGNHT